MLHPIGILHHDAGISSDPVAVKCGLCQPSLPAMKLALTGQQAVTQHPLCALETASFLEVRIVGNKDVFDVFRMIDKEIVLRPGHKVANVTKLVRGSHQKCDRVTAE
jgi:hypothetical protein